MVDEGPERAMAEEKEEEMTVVVPPPKSSKLSGEPGKDVDGDISMDNIEKEAADGPKEETVDPTVKAVAGQYLKSLSFYGTTVESCANTT